MQCFLCQEDNFKAIYDLKNKQILQCQNDGLFFSQLKKGNKLYGKKYFEVNPHPTSSNEKYFEEKLEKIKELTKETDPTILDIGCGWGDFLQILKKEGIRYKGIDQSDDAIMLCRSKGLNVQKLLLQDLYEKEKVKYSAITFFQMIEHVPNPIPLLQSAKKLLKKNGVILVTTPNNDSPLRKIFGKKWSVYQEPSHFVFYNKKTLFQTLELAGFKNVKVRNDNWRFLSLGYILNKILNSEFKILNSVPVPTDPFGDLEAVAFNK